MTTKIEIVFPVDVVVLDSMVHDLAEMIEHYICQPYEKAHPDRVMWTAGFGDKPHWSQVDSAFLGKEPDPNAPKTGEPTFDDSVFQIEVAERKNYDYKPG